jgi:hypothetical protein
MVLKNAIYNNKISILLELNKDMNLLLDNSNIVSINNYLGFTK